MKAHKMMNSGDFGERRFHRSGRMNACNFDVNQRAKQRARPPDSGVIFHKWLVKSVFLFFIFFIGAYLTGISLLDDCVGCEYAPDAVSNMFAGQRGTADIFNILVKLRQGSGIFSRKLLAPVGITHLEAVSFLIIQYLNILEASVGIKA